MMATATKRLLGRSFFRIFEMLHRKPVRAERGSVVIVRADGIGDLVFSLPVIEAIRQKYANRRCLLVCNTVVASLINDLGVVDVVLPYDTVRYRWDPIYRLSIWRKLRRIAPSVAISIGYHRSRTSEELTMSAGAETTICMSGNDEMILDTDRRRFDKEYSLVVDVPDHVSERERYELLAKSQGWPSIAWSKEYAVRVHSPDPGEGLGSRSGTRPVIAFCPGGLLPIRQWPQDRWISLVRGFMADNDFECRLVGGIPDGQILEIVASKLEKPITIQVAPDVRALSALLAEADLIVGIDSGASHIAARLARPTVVILGGGHFSRYFPYGSASICNAAQECYECNWRCTRDKNYCLTEITVEVVRAEMLRRLGIVQ